MTILPRWCDIFVLWMMRGLEETNLEKVQKMLYDLPEVEDTIWGRELKEKWTLEGEKKGKLEGELKGELKGKLETLQRVTKRLSDIDRRYNEGEISQNLFSELYREERLEQDALLEEKAALEKKLASLTDTE